MKFNLFHALTGKTTTEDPTTGCPGTTAAPDPRGDPQTDRGITSTSGDSRERPAFDWSQVPAVDPDEVDRWLGCTDAKDRQFPLQVALQVHDEIERTLMAPGRMDALSMAELRGGLCALKRFATLYSGILGNEANVKV